MNQRPVCREAEFDHIVEALQAGVRLIVMTGPMSSGKTTTIQRIINSNILGCSTIHIFCETGMDQKEFYQNLANTIAKSDKYIKAFSTFFDSFLNWEKTVIFFDSFDLLQENSRQIFAAFQAAVNGNLLPQFSFVFSSRQRSTTFTSDPIKVFTVDFNSYTLDQIRRIVISSKEHKDVKSFEKFFNRVMRICAPVTHDVRDIIYITYKMLRQEQQKETPDEEFSQQIVNDLRDIRVQESSKTVDLSRVAGCIFLAAYIGSHTSPSSDLLRLTRAAQRSRKHPALREKHEYVTLGRVLAIAKALDFHHCDMFDFDFGVYIQIQTLVQLKLIELRGDQKQDPKVKFIATEEDVKAVARDLDIDIYSYTGDAK